MEEYINVQSKIIAPTTIAKARNVKHSVEAHNKGFINSMSAFSHGVNNEQSISIETRFEGSITKI